ncbi:MAG: hypothetical protein LBC56_03455 [Oscillospiraceae bacterium]|jgi:Na+-transporting methylmalonyl-CoA/oxaloacetate decarboxylase beta subunit|nr:hypothetical protein [Oscillospiraceae bacterium]
MSKFLKFISATGAVFAALQFFLASFAVFVSIFSAVSNSEIKFSPKSASTAIIGGADGPTAIYINSSAKNITLSLIVAWAISAVTAVSAAAGFVAFRKKALEK